MARSFDELVGLFAAAAGTEAGTAPAGAPALVPIGPDITGLSVAAGYRLAAAWLAEVCRTTGRTLAGYKLSITCEEDQAIVGAHAPAVGRIFADAIVESGAVIDLATANGPLLEPEVAFRVLRTLEPTMTDDDLADAVEAAPGIEVPLCRIDGWWPAGQAPQMTLASAAADNAVGGYVVTGAWSRLTAAQLASLTVVLDGPGGLHAEGSAQRVTGGPLGSLRWLVDALAFKGEELTCGEIVSSGTLLPATRAGLGTYRATYDLLGPVEVTFA